MFDLSISKNRLGFFQRENYSEFTRRLSLEIIKNINSEMDNISSNEVDEFIKLLNNTENIFYNNKLIYNQKFPYFLLKSYLNGKISLSFISSMLVLWKCSQEFLTIENLRKYNPRFVKLNIKNTSATATLLDYCDFISNLNLEVSKLDLANYLSEKIKSLPDFEHGTWVFDNFERSDNSIADRINETINSSFLCRVIKNSDKENSENSLIKYREIIPNFSLIQIILNKIIGNPVSINLVLGISSVEDIHIGTKFRYRDIAIPFPGVNIPKVADGYSAPTIIEFLKHDLYHCLKSSLTSRNETFEYLYIAERFENIQIKMKLIIDELKKRHLLHVNQVKKILLKRYPENYNFNNELIDSNLIKLESNEINYIFKKIINERKIIKLLEDFGKFLGRYKFELYDMDTEILSINDGSYGKNVRKTLNRIILNLSGHMDALIYRNPSLAIIFIQLSVRIAFKVLGFYGSNNEINGFLLYFKKNKEQFVGYNSNFFSIIEKLPESSFCVNDFIDMIINTQEKFKIEMLFRQTLYERRYYILSSEALNNIAKILNIFSFEDILNILKIKIYDHPFASYIISHGKMINDVLSLLIEKSGLNSLDGLKELLNHPEVKNSQKILKFTL